MTKKELDLLEKVFEAEVNGQLYQGKCKTTKKLEEDGLIRMHEERFHVPPLGFMTVKGYVTTLEGNMNYCMSDRCSEEPTPGRGRKC